MTIFVDEIKHHPTSHLTSKHWCRMWSDQGDSPYELHAMATVIGLQHSWFQKNHYDLTPAKQELAIRAGAVAVTNEHGAMIRANTSQMSGSRITT